VVATCCNGGDRGSDRYIGIAKSTPLADSKSGAESGGSAPSFLHMTRQNALGPVAPRLQCIVTAPFHVPTVKWFHTDARRFFEEKRAPSRVFALSRAQIPAQTKKGPP
jgi:hypothetical protein